MKLRILLYTLLSSCAAQAFAQTVLNTPCGSAGDRFGAASVVAGDQNADGYTDVLVGSPGFNGGRGSIHCISGKFLANGSSPNVLWSIITPPVNAGAAFGASMIQVGNLTGNSAVDFVVGAPNYIPTGAFDTRGAIFLIDGSTHAVVTFINGLPQTHFGQTMVAVGDQTGDGKTDIAVSAPDVSSSAASLVHIVPGAAFGFSTALATISHPSHSSSWHEYGAALASGFDYDGDGKLDLAISIPNYGFSFPNAGYVEVRKANTFGLITAYTTNVAGERFGSSIDASGDYDNDGVIDLVVGAPNAPNGSAYEVGRAVVVSVARILSQAPPYEIYSFPYGGSVTPPVNHSDPEPNIHFGAAVRACGDLNNDGVGDILVGAPGYFTQSFTGVWNFRGLVRIYSGATGTPLANISGASTDRLGDSLTGTLDDFDGDGFEDFVVAGSLSDICGTDGGVMKSYRLFPTAPSSYCAGKVNSQGCTPAMSSSGSASASSASAFTLSCANALNQVNGLLFYSHAPNAAPFQGGTLCVNFPLQRTLVLNSGGSTSGTDCTGVFAYDFNARIQSGIDATLVVGAEVFVQCWSRDPASPSTTSLSNALRLLINP